MDLPRVTSIIHKQLAKTPNTGDMVLRNILQATKDPAQGELVPNWEGPYKVVRFSREGSYHLEDLNGNPLPRPWNVEHLKKYYQ